MVICWRRLIKLLKLSPWPQNDDDKDKDKNVAPYAHVHTSAFQVWQCSVGEEYIEDKNKGEEQKRG